MKILVMKLEMTKSINNEILREYLGYQNPTFLAKDLLMVSQVKNSQIKNRAIYSMNESRNAVIRKKLLEMKIQI